MNERARGWRVDETLDRAPLRFHRTIPGYAATPFRNVEALARAAGVRELWVKDETNRLGLPSFKAVGTSWGVAAALSRGPATLETFADLLAAAAAAPSTTLAAPTDGNHGRALARIALLCGLKARIFVPTPVAQARVDALVEEGAEVVTVAGDYDAAIAQCVSDARSDPTVMIVSDTSWPGYERVPAAIIDGYDTIFHEIDDELSAGTTALDAIFVQVGAGGLAASVIRHFRRGPNPPAIIAVEPIDADCALQAARAGTIVTVPGPHQSIMAGLNCATASHVAWRHLARGVDLFLAIDDECTRPAARELKAAGILAGETGAAGLAGLFALAGKHDDRTDAARISPTARVAIICTEGVTDPISWNETTSAPLLQHPGSTHPA